MAVLAQLVDDVVVHKVELDDGVLTMGRHPDNDLVIDDSAVSAQHARIICVNNPDFPTFQEVYVEDLGSTNGTYVNEVKISGKQRLHDRDMIRLAWNQFRLMDCREPAMDATVHMLQE